MPGTIALYLYDIPNVGQVLYKERCQIGTALNALKKSSLTSLKCN